MRKKSIIISIFLFTLLVTMVLLLVSCKDTGDTNKEEQKEEEKNWKTTSAIAYAGSGSLVSSQNNIPSTQLDTFLDEPRTDIGSLLDHFLSGSIKRYQNVSLSGYEDYLMQYQAQGWTALEVSEKHSSFFKDTLTVSVERGTSSMTIFEVLFDDTSFINYFISQNNIISDFGWPSTASWNCIGISEHVKKPADITELYFLGDSSNHSLSIKLKDASQDILASAINVITNNISLNGWYAENGDSIHISNTGIKETMRTSAISMQYYASCVIGEIKYMLSARLVTANSDGGNSGDARILIRVVNANEDNPFFNAYTSFAGDSPGIYTSGAGDVVELFSDASLLIDKQRYYAFYDSEGNSYYKKDSFYITYYSYPYQKLLIIEGVRYSAPNKQGYTICLNSSEIAGEYAAEYGGNYTILDDGTYNEGNILYVKDGKYYDRYKTLLDFEGDSFLFTLTDTVFHRVYEVTPLSACDIAGTYVSYFSESNVIGTIEVTEGGDFLHENQTHQLYRTTHGAFYIKENGYYTPINYDSDAQTLTVYSSVYGFSTDEFTPYIEPDINSLYCFSLDYYYFFTEIKDGILTCADNEFDIYKYGDKYYISVAEREYSEISLDSSEITLFGLIYTKTSDALIMQTDTSLIAGTYPYIYNTNIVITPEGKITIWSETRDIYKYGETYLIQYDQEYKRFSISSSGHLILGEPMPQ